MNSIADLASSFEKAQRAFQTAYGEVRKARASELDSVLEAKETEIEADAMAHGAAARLAFLTSDDTVSEVALAMDVPMVADELGATDG